MKNKYRKSGKGLEQTEEKFHKTNGWLTDDEYEIRLRRHRAETEDMSVKKLDGFPGIFSDYAVSRKDADKKTSYTVELRSLDSHTNFCTCPDFKKNFLGTCKHIEKILLKPVMIRRRKTDISEQLPERIDNNYFVGITEEQRKRYDEYEYQVSIMLRMAQKHPLREAEMKRLQRLLACMRMLCDSVFILDRKTKDAPKVDELFRILDDI
ncbi:MAG: hypothetical protein A2X45_24730 [Lentisphaerae bacterium GWF2_50_93]|nr:MAG: hypothetical protein A2X45_24730 [Lentisphaerae bacterium GWF2_50_93]